MVYIAWVCQVLASTILITDCIQTQSTDQHRPPLGSVGRIYRHNTYFHLHFKVAETPFRSQRRGGIIVSGHS